MAYGGGGYTQTAAQTYGGGGVGGDATKRRDAKGVFPVTIAEILQNFNQTEDKLTVGTTDVSDIVVVAQVSAIKQSSTKIVFTLDDKSGASIEANYWLDSDASSDKTDSLPQVLSYLQAFGKIKSFGGRPQMNMFAWKPVTDVDTIALHILQTIHAHHTLLNPVTVTNQGGGLNPAVEAPINRFGGTGTQGVGKPQQQQYPAANDSGFMPGNNTNEQQQFGEYGKGIVGLPQVQQDVYKVVLSDKTNSGMNKDVLKRQLAQRYKPQQVEEALTMLRNEGFIYPTVDDTHFAALN